MSPLAFREIFCNFTIQMIGCEKEVHYLALAIFFSVRKIISFLIATPYNNLSLNAFSNCQISSSVTKQPLVVIIHGMIKNWNCTSFLFYMVSFRFGFKNIYYLSCHMLFWQLFVYSNILSFWIREDINSRLWIFCRE